MKVKIKKLDDRAIIPQYSKAGDAGLDITAIDVEVTRDYIQYKTGLSFEVPAGFVALLFPRSSISNYDLNLCNSVGVLDSGYRGELLFRFNTTIPFQDAKIYQVGDRIGQIMILPYPQIKFVESEELTNSERGTGGYGSSGK
jgi:dUTP pyrophosphatase